MRDAGTCPAWESRPVLSSVIKAVTLTTESCGSPDAAAGSKTLPGIAARPVLEVITAATVVLRRLTLKGSDWITRMGRRLAGLLPWPSASRRRLTPAASEADSSGPVTWSASSICCVSEWMSRSLSDVAPPPTPVPLADERRRCMTWASSSADTVSPRASAVAGHVCPVSLLGSAAFVRGADRRDWAGDRTPAGCVRSTMRRDGALPVDFPGNRCTEHADAPACEDGPDGGTGCAVQVPYHEASQEECPDDQAPDDPHGVGWPILHWPAPRGWPGTHLVQEDPHGSAAFRSGVVVGCAHRDTTCRLRCRSPDHL